MMNQQNLTPRQLAGQRNRLKRRGLTVTGRSALRAAALLNRPWQYSTGPKTANGKARAAANGRRRQYGSLSVRECRRQLADVTELVNEMQKLRLTAGAQRQP